MKKQPSRQHISHAVGWLQFVLELVHRVERILFNAVAGDVGDGELAAVAGEGEDAPEGFVALLVPLELDGPGGVAAGGLDDVEAAAVGHVVGVGHAAVGGEAEGGAVALPGAEKVGVGVGVFGLVDAEIVDLGAVGQGHGAVAEAQAGVVGPGLAVAGDGDEQVRQHVADVAGQDHRHALALVEGLPGLAVLAVLVDGPGLDGDLGPVVAGDDAVDFIALLGHDLALGEVLQEGVLFPVAALLQERVDRGPGDGAAQVGDAAEVVAGLEGVPEGREGDVLGGAGLGRVSGAVGAVGAVGGVRGGRVRGRVGVCRVGLVRVPAAGRQGEGQQGGQAQGGKLLFRHKNTSCGWIGS